MPIDISSKADRTQKKMSSLCIADLADFDIVRVVENESVETLCLHIRPDLAVSITPPLRICNIRDGSVIKREGYIDFSSNMINWPGNLCAAFLFGKLLLDIGWYPNTTNAHVSRAADQFMGCMSSFVEANRNPAAYGSAFIEYRRAVSSIRSPTNTASNAKKEEERIKKPSKASSRRLRRKFHERISKKKWSATSKKAGVNLPTSTVQIRKLLSENRPDVNTQNSGKVFQSVAQLKRFIHLTKYPNVLVLTKKNDVDMLLDMPGYVVVDCSKLPKHFAAKEVKDHYLLIKRGYNLCDEEDSIEPCWVYGVEGNHKRKVFSCKEDEAEKQSEPQAVVRDGVSLRSFRHYSGEPAAHTATTT